MILELSCVVILQEYHLIFSLQLSPYARIDWEEELHYHESIVSIISDKVLCYDTIGTHGNDDFFRASIYHLISSYPLFFEKVIELMCAFYGHASLELWVFARRTILIVLI